jgi:hypothetical protein
VKIWKLSIGETSGMNFIHKTFSSSLHGFFVAR